MRETSQIFKSLSLGYKQLQQLYRISMWADPREQLISAPPS